MEAFDEEANLEVAVTADDDDDDLSTLPGTEEVVEVQTPPRRSRRKIRKPERYQY